MKPMRLRINTDIITEFLPPRRGKGDKALIFCDGMPSVPSKRYVLDYWSRRGYWVFHPRYKGTWESGGHFLDHDPTLDIIEVAHTIRNGSLISTRKNFDHVPIPKITHISVIGASFGGAVALLSSLYPEVDRVVAISPVIDWSSELNNPIESLPDLKNYIRNGFGEAYRFSDHHFDRLGREVGFFNPIAHIHAYDPNKVFILHAKDDMIVSYDKIAEFINTVKCPYELRRRGGHLSSAATIAFFGGRNLRRFVAS